MATFDKQALSSKPHSHSLAFLLYRSFHSRDLSDERMRNKCVALQVECL